MKLYNGKDVYSIPTDRHFTGVGESQAEKQPRTEPKVLELALYQKTHFKTVL